MDLDQYLKILGYTAMWTKSVSFGVFRYICSCSSLGQLFHMNSSTWRDLTYFYKLYMVLRTVDVSSIWYIYCLPAIQFRKCYQYKYTLPF